MLADIVERLSNWKHASFRRDGSTLETMHEAAEAITTLRARVKGLELELKHQDSLKDFVSNLEPYAYEIDEDAIHQLNKRISQSEKDGSAKPINLNIIYKDLER